MRDLWLWQLLDQILNLDLAAFLCSYIFRKKNPHFLPFLSLFFFFPSCKPSPAFLCLHLLLELNQASVEWGQVFLGIPRGLLTRSQRGHMGSCELSLETWSFCGVRSLFIHSSCSWCYHLLAMSSWPEIWQLWHGVPTLQSAVGREWVNILRTLNCSWTMGHSVIIPGRWKSLRDTNLLREWSSALELLWTSFGNNHCSYWESRSVCCPFSARWAHFAHSPFHGTRQEEWASKLHHLTSKDVCSWTHAWKCVIILYQTCCSLARVCTDVFILC